MKYTISLIGGEHGHIDPKMLQSLIIAFTDLRPCEFQLFESDPGYNAIMNCIHDVADDISVFETKDSDSILRHIKPTAENIVVLLSFSQTELADKCRAQNIHVLEYDCYKREK